MSNNPNEYQLVAGFMLAATFCGGFLAGIVVLLALQSL